MKYVSAEQLKTALAELAKFTGAVGKQRAQHVLPFLALKLKGVNVSGFTPYSESDDREFYERFAKVREDDDPYFDPLEGRFRIATHYHSNVATARKGTFAKSWAVARLRKPRAGEQWKFEKPYLPRMRRRMLRRVGTKGEVRLIPAAPLAVFLYRKESFPDSLTIDNLIERFYQNFNINASERTRLFTGETVIGQIPFADEPLSDEAIESMASSAEVVGPIVINKTDPILKRTMELLYHDRMSGVVLVGPPGTSKSWYGAQVALYLADNDPARVHNIQFHKSYQYENFVEGYVPREDGSGFELKDQLLLRVAEDAERRPDQRFVILIDELSRSDPGRVFGEVLTYMEPSRRGELFILPSGRRRRLPPNVVFIATMNARDKSVSEIDDAFDRRMGKIALDPNVVILRQFLERNEMAPELRRRVEAFFAWVNEKHYPLGHTFFLTVQDEDSLRRLWDTQLRFVFEKEFRFQPETVKTIKDKYHEIVFGGAGTPAGGTA